FRNADRTPNQHLRFRRGWLSVLRFPQDRRAAQYPSLDRSEHPHPDLLALRAETLISMGPAPASELALVGGCLSTGVLDDGFSYVERGGFTGDRCSGGCGSRQNSSLPQKEFGPLLLVVCCFLFVRLCLLISSVRGYHAGLAIGCYNNATCGCCLAILLYGECQRVVINLLVRPHIGLGITGDGIVVSVKLARPLIMRRLTVLVGAIDGNFHLV